jgi:hypothetical protein
MPSSTAKKVREWAPGEYESTLVAPVVSSDETRAHMCKPWGQVINGRGFICGTDGHRLHAAACAPDAWQGYKRDNAPPGEQVIPWDAKWLGEVNVGALDDARAFTARWIVAVDVQPHAVLAHVSVKTGSGKASKTLRPFGIGGVRVDWFKLEQLAFSFGMDLHYLLDALDFVGTGIVHLWGGGKTPELSPVAFSSSSKPLREADRVAVVMPMRV